MEKYVASTENRKHWCRGKVGRPHEFEYFHYHLKSKVYQDRPSYFEFHCVICGRRRYTVDEDGEIEFEFSDLDGEEIPIPRPKSILLRVLVDSIAEDGSVRRISSHTTSWNVGDWPDWRLDSFRGNLLKAAYSASEKLSRGDYMHEPFEEGSPIDDDAQ